MCGFEYRVELYSDVAKTIALYIIPHNFYPIGQCAAKKWTKGGQVANKQPFIYNSKQAFRVGHSEGNQKLHANRHSSRDFLIAHAQLVATEFRGYRAIFRSNVVKK